MPSRSRAVLLLAAATLAATAWLSPRLARSSPETQPAAAAATTAPSDAPATQPAASAASAAAATQPSATTRPSADIRLNFKNTPLDALLEHLSQVAGLTIIKEAPIEGRVTLMSMQPVTAQEAVAVLNPVLKGNGLTAIQDGRTLRIVSSTKAKKGNLPVH